MGPQTHTTPIADRPNEGRYGKYYRMKAGAKLTERERFMMPYPVAEPGEGVGESAYNVLQNGGVGIFEGVDAILHPVRTVESLVASVTPGLKENNEYRQAHGLPVSDKDRELAATPNPAAQVAEGMEHPGEFIPEMLGQALLFGKVGEAVAPVTRGLMEKYAKVKEGVRTSAQSLMGAGDRAVKGEVLKAGEKAKTADEAHLAETQDALHESTGRELAHKQAVDAANETAADVNKALDEQHLKSVQDALQQTREKEDLYQNDLRKAQAESDEAYQKKLAEVNEKRAKEEADRKQELSDYFKKKEKIRSDNQKAADAANRKYALNRGVEKLDPKLKADVEAEEKRVNTEANAKYTDLRKSLRDEKSGMYQAKDEEGHIQGEPISVPQRLYDTASSSLRGSETEPAIIKDLAKRVENGELSLTYDDLQGYREEVGRELRKGTLPPDVYDAYKKIMPQIDDAMQEIADRQGLGSQQADARAYYRQYAETFLDKDSPIRKALNTVERGDVSKTFIGMDQSGIEQLAKYNPELARRMNTVRGYAKEGKGIVRPPQAKAVPPVPPKSAPIPQPEPVAPRDVTQPSRVEPPDRPTPIEAKTPKPPERVPLPDRPEQTEVNTRELREKLVDKWATGESSLNKWQVRALLSGGLSALVDAAGLLGRHTPGIGSMVMEAGGTAAYTFGPAAVAKLLEKPGFREWITRPPAGELETLQKLPSADRLKLTDGLGKVIQQAQKEGIKVDPRLAALVGATAPKGKVQQQLEDVYANSPHP
jgi:hypothetical protein